MWVVVADWWSWPSSRHRSSRRTKRSSPTGEHEAEALKVVGLPGVPDVMVKAAVGAWSGVMAMRSGRSTLPR